MKFSKTEIFGFESAIRGMRNPLESWEKSDSFSFNTNENLDHISEEIWQDSQYTNKENCIYIGPNDYELAMRLIKGGPEHRKFLRMIHVQVDMTAPLYVWKEFDTYKVGTVANSTSTMHKIQSKPITLDCFEIDDLTDMDMLIPLVGTTETLEHCTNVIIDMCEGLRQKYLATEDKRYWKELIRWLPESWLQTRTLDLNYEVLRTIYHQRKNHKLTEWHTFCKWVEILPYHEFITD